VLVYYDKTYRSGLSKRLLERIVTIVCRGNDASENTKQILANLHKMMTPSTNH